MSNQGQGGDSSLRQRKKDRNPVLGAVEQLDAFPKLPDTCVKTTNFGGSASVVAVVMVIWLVLLETRYFLDSEFKFKFQTDNQIDDKLAINVDITVAMPCGILGSDVVDSTNQNVMKFGELEEEYAHFELNDKQKAYFNAKSHLNSYLREEYHSLSNLLWKNEFINIYSEMPTLTREEKQLRGIAKACRLYGTLVLNKVAGNFHITAGKTLPLPRGHAHIAAFMSERDYNFSHRIYKFSFGEGSSSIVHPLEGDEKVTTENQMLYNYFIQIVPTTVKTRFKNFQTYQYSVKEFSRSIDHHKGSHGISGIFFKYDMSGFKVEVKEEVYPIWEFLIRICAIIGGTYATVGMLYTQLELLGCQLHFFSSNENQEIPKHHNNTTKSHSRKSSISSPLLLQQIDPSIDLIHQPAPYYQYDNNISQSTTTNTTTSPNQNQNQNLNDSNKSSLPDLLLATHK